MDTTTASTTFTATPTMAYSLRTMNRALAAGRTLGRLIARLSGAATLPTVTTGVDATS